MAGGQENLAGVPGGDFSQPLNTEATLHQLEGQGFSPDEALRLIAAAGRLEDRPEAREAAATLRRLRFTRWMVENGIIDEWSA